MLYVCFGGHCITPDHTLSPHLLVGWMYLWGSIFMIKSIFTFSWKKIIQIKINTIYSTVHSFLKDTGSQDEYFSPVKLNLYFLCMHQCFLGYLVEEKNEFPSLSLVDFLPLLIGCKKKPSQCTTVSSCHRRLSEQFLESQWAFGNLGNSLIAGKSFLQRVL
jgi:hypothetical protein